MNTSNFKSLRLQIAKPIALGLIGFGMIFLTSQSANAMVHECGGGLLSNSLENSIKCYQSVNTCKCACKSGIVSKKSSGGLFCGKPGHDASGTAVQVWPVLPKVPHN